MTSLSARQEQRYGDTALGRDSVGLGRPELHPNELVAPILRLATAPGFVLRGGAVDRAVLQSGLVAATEPNVSRLPTDEFDTNVDGLARSRNSDPVCPVLKVPAPRMPRQKSVVLQQWEGTVVEVGPDSFGARMKNLTDLNGPEEWATILLEEIWERVGDEERRQVHPGAVFYWSIGYLDEPHGTRMTMSTIYFRRLPAWSALDLARAQKAAEDYGDIF
jgi:hypothetical protein